MSNKIIIEASEQYIQSATDPDKIHVIRGAIQILSETDEFIPDFIGRLHKLLKDSGVKYDRMFINKTIREATHFKNQIIEIHEIGDSIDE